LYYSCLMTGTARFRCGERGALLACRSPLGTSEDNSRAATFGIVHWKRSRRSISIAHTLDSCGLRLVRRSTLTRSALVRRLAALQFAVGAVALVPGLTRDCCTLARP